MGSNQFTCTVFRIRIDSDNKHGHDNRRMFWHDHSRVTATLNAAKIKRVMCFFSFNCFL